MNKRIKELAEHARDFAVQEVDVNCEGSLDEALDAAFEQKFAELIVRECASIASKNNYVDRAHPGAGAAVDFLKYFGVEE